MMSSTTLPPRLCPTLIRPPAVALGDVTLGVVADAPDDGGVGLELGIAGRPAERVGDTVVEDPGEVALEPVTQRRPALAHLGDRFVPRLVGALELRAAQLALQQRLRLGEDRRHRVGVLLEPLEHRLRPREGMPALRAQ